MDHPHIPVLLQEFLSFFHHRQVRIFLDGTLGAGGFSEAMLKQHPEIELLIGIDQDPFALEIAQKRLNPWKEKLLLIQGNFEKLDKHLEKAKISKVDGMVFDIGVSSMQFDQPEKGFSLMRDGPLDMRMDPFSSLTAQEILNTYSEEKLGRIFRDYGEEKRWRLAARSIIKARESASLVTTFDLNKALSPLYNKKPGIHPFTLVYQALRIYVNRELEVLENLVPLAVEHLALEGRLGIISFHSLEDRIVKHLFRFFASDKFDNSGLGGGLFLDKDPIIKLLTRKAVTPTQQEIAFNPRCRSAKLRVIEKI